MGLPPGVMKREMAPPPWKLPVLSALGPSWMPLAVPLVTSDMLVRGGDGLETRD